MFKKLHRQMTIFASLITSGILILMAVSCLVISERGLTHNTYERFLNNGNSCVAYLENQTGAFSQVDTGSKAGIQSGISYSE